MGSGEAESREGEADFPSRRLRALARADSLRLLYRQSFPAVFASVITSALVVYVLWPVADHDALVAWFGAFVLAALLRVRVFLRFWQRDPAPEEISHWERAYAATLFLSAGLWGFGVALLLPREAMVEAMTVFALVVGMTGGAFAMYSSRYPMMLGATLLVLSPAALWFAWYGGGPERVVVIGCAMFVVAIVRSGRVLANGIHDSLLLGHTLKGSLARAHRAAREDALTGLGNRRAFYEADTRVRGRKQNLLCLILLDLDHFKRVNDRYGHATGDRVLQQVGALLRRAVRSSDLCVRLGGEEFGVLIRVGDKRDAVALAEKLRRRLARLEFDLSETGNAAGCLRMTGSFGVANGEPDDLDGLYRRADAALYRAKALGRNRVESLFDPMLQTA